MTTENSNKNISLEKFEEWNSNWLQKIQRSLGKISLEKVEE